MDKATTSSSGKRVEPWGPVDAKIVIVGEAPGETEEERGRPFVGASGKLLHDMLRDAGIDMDECRLTNVFKERPPANKLEAWYVDKKALPADYRLPALGPGKYMDPAKAHYVSELHDELGRYKPNLIIALGNTATWGLGLGTGISNLRGRVTPTRWGKVLATYHPAAIFRTWSWRVVAAADFLKASAESKFPEIRRPERCLLIEPTFEEVLKFFSDHLDGAREVSFDIETKAGGITCFALAPSEKLALCIPLWDPRKPGKSYWSFEEEFAIWKMVKHLYVTRVRNRTIRFMGQNILYDIQYMDKCAELRLPEVGDDTMLMHHALFPEMQKGLGFLASVHTNELAWKQMVKHFGRDK